MNAVSFHDAEAPTNFGDLIPVGALSFAILKIRPHNLDQGMIEVHGKTLGEDGRSKSHYLDCELTLMGGPWDKRKIFTKIGVYGSEKYVNMGRTSIKAILEVGRGAGPQNMAAYGLSASPQGVNWMELDGLQVAIKVKVEKSEGYADKNEVGVYLSPIEPSTQKDFAKLLAGDVQPAVKAATAAATAAKQPWATGAPATATPAPAAAAGYGQQQAAPAQQGYGQPPATRAPGVVPPGNAAGGAKPAWLTGR